MSNKNLVSVILPVLKEPNLKSLINDIKKSARFPLDIIIVGSDKVREFPVADGDVRVFKSYGDSLERAILLGFSVALGEKIVVMDADGSHDLAVLPLIIEGLNSYEMVVASRFAANGCYRSTVFRRLTSLAFTKYAQLMGSTLSDPMSGYFGVRSNIVQRMRFKPIKWKTCLEISNRLRPNTLEVPYTFVNRKVGVSKSSWRVAVRLAYDIMVTSL